MRSWVVYDDLHKHKIRKLHAMRDGASRQEYSAMHALSVPLGEYSGYELGNPDLPIANHRSEIERAIRDNQVVIVEGQTGSGKSTQIAQYAYDMGFDKIVETQPRIPAARSISERIAEEMVAVRGAAIARRVGFRTAEFGNTTKETKIVTATDGLALQWGRLNTAGQGRVLDLARCARGNPVQEMMDRALAKIHEGYRLCWVTF